MLSAALILITMVSALVLQTRRDLGSSLVREAGGRSTGKQSFRSGLALVWRQQWPSLGGWALGGAFIGSLAGTLSGKIGDTADLAPSMQQMLALFVPGGQGALIDLLVTAIIGIAGVLAAAAGVQVIMRARSEESDGLAELVLAAPLSRARWLLGYVTVAISSTVAVALATGLSAGLSFTGSADAAPRFWSSTLAGIAQLPAALSFVALTTLVFVLLPRLTVALGWAILAVAFTLGEFGGILQIPDWARNLSPFTHTPSVPSEGVDWGWAFVLLLASSAVLLVSVFFARQRPLTL
jgi:ABC-2 type transport system permease protein